MAGCVVQIAPSRQFDFGSVANGSSVDIVLRRNLDASCWIAASIMVRVSKADMLGGNVFVTASMEAQSPDDPGVEFVLPVVGEGAIGVTVDNTIAAPFFQSAPLGAGLGGALRIIARGSRTSASGNIALTMSVDVCFKNGS